MTGLRCAMLVLASALAGVPAGATCVPLPGVEALWARPATRIVMVGEMHGSRETPRLFGELVCQALEAGKDVVVGLERPTAEQKALDAVLTGTDLTRAEVELLDEPGWREVWDGRSSLAMLQLLERLRALRVGHRSLEILAVDPGSRDGGASRDASTGGSLRDFEGKHPAKTMLVLMGNGHAMLNPVFGYQTAAMYLPREQTVTLEATDRGGTTWSDRGQGCGSIDGSVGEKQPSRLVGVYLDPSLVPIGTMDGVLSVGGMLTASRPASNAAASPCSEAYRKAHSAKSAGSGAAQ